MIRAALIAVLLAAPVAGQTVPVPARPTVAGDPTLRVPAADLQATIAGMIRDLKPGQTFLWHPVVRSGGNVAALELWTEAGKPAVHPTQDEYIVVEQGTGTLVTGGRMIDPVTTNPTLIEATRVEGANRQPLGPGDVVLIPAGTPHYFEVSGVPLILLGTKLTAAAK